MRAFVVAEADASLSAGSAPGQKAGNAVAPAKAAAPGKGGRKRARSALQYVPPYSHQRRQLSGRNSIGFSCLWIDAGLHLKGGATGNILSWSAGAELSIWESPAWELFHVRRDLVIPPNDITTDVMWRSNAGPLDLPRSLKLASPHTPWHRSTPCRRTRPVRPYLRQTRPNVRTVVL